MRVHRLVFSPIEVNTYILEDESGDCAVIDCGCYDDEEFSELSGFITERSLKPVLLLNTHCHLDHIFGNRYMLGRYNLRSHWAEAEEPNRVNAPQHAMLFGLNMEAAPEPESFITDNREFIFGKIVLKTLFVPGHSPGGVAFYSENDNCVFTGDALFAGSIGRTDLPGGNFDQLTENIRARLFTLPSGTIVYPGHGEATTIDHEMKHNPWFR